jgi:hypothetical protein
MKQEMKQYLNDLAEQVEARARRAKPSVVNVEEVMREAAKPVVVPKKQRKQRKGKK